MNNMKRFFALFAAIPLLCAISCAPIEEDEDQWSYMNFDEKEAWALYDPATEEVIDLPIELCAYRYNENGDDCWTYYYRHDAYVDPDTYPEVTIEIEYEPYRQANIRIRLDDDLPLDFFNDMIYYRGTIDLAYEYLTIDGIFDRSSILHRPTYNPFDSERYGEDRYEIILPTIVEEREVISMQGKIYFEIQLFSCSEKKWYRTEEYVLIYHDDEIDGENASLGGKVELMTSKEYWDRISGRSIGIEDNDSSL